MKKLLHRIKNALRKETPAFSRVSLIFKATTTNDCMSQVAALSVNQPGVASTGSNAPLVPVLLPLTARKSGLPDLEEALTTPIAGPHPVANPFPSVDLVPASSATASRPDLVSNAPSSATSPELPPHPNPLPRTNISAYILKKALEKLDLKERATLQHYTSSSTADARTALNAAHQAARDRQAVCRCTRTVWTLGKHSVELRDISDRVVKWLDRFKAVLDVAVNADPIHAALPWAGVRVLLEIAITEQRKMAALLSGLDAVLYYGSRMTVYFEVLTDFPAGDARMNFETALVKLQVSMMRFLAEGISWSQKSFTRRSLEAFWGTESISNFESECGAIATQAEQEASICGRVIIGDMSQKLKSFHDISISICARLNKDQLSKLEFVRGAKFDSYQEEGKDERQCLKGTRENLQARIRQWVDDPEGKSIFWLYGGAGTGKSTISRTVAQSINDKGQLGASFFFKRDRDRGSARWLFTTIARQLSCYLPEIVPFVAEAVDDDPDISGQPPRDQFEKLILYPLSKVSGEIFTIVLVIDALDECDEKGIGLLIPLLARVKEAKAVRLRVFLTSRPEKLIDDTFRAVSKNRDHVIDRAALEGVPNTKDDISAFLKDELSKTRKDEKDVGPIWPGPEVIEELARMAEPLFIFATTICRFIQDEMWLPTDQLDIIRISGLRSQASKLDQTYLPVFTQLLQNQDALQTRRLESEFREVLGTVALLAEPLPVLALTNFVTISAEVLDKRLERLNSVLSIPHSKELPVKMFHLSFREFLLDCEKRDKYWFWVSEEETHGRIALKCLEIMSSQTSSRHDLRNMKQPGVARSKVDWEVVDDFWAAQVQYACQYWVYHVEKSEGHFRDAQAVLMFLQTYLLQWFEVLSWMGKISDGVNMIITLQSLFDIDKESKLSDFLYDAHRFLLSYRSIADSSPLQLYSSALIFAPKASIIRKRFQSCVPSWISQQPEMQSNWNAVQLTLEGHGNGITSVAFSHDSRLLASASWDKTIKIWETSTGSLQQTLYSHDNRVTSITFSYDSKLLASASDDETVKIWDTSTGILRQTLKDSRGVLSVAFSHDAKLLASASDNKIIKIWDAKTGSIRQTLNSHKSGVTSVAFSHYSRLLASGSDDETIKIWDAITGALQQTLKGHSSRVTSVAFSYNSNLLASASWDKTVKIWNISTGSVQQTLEGHSSGVTSVAFSHDSRLLASASWDKTVKIWDASTGSIQQILKDHGGRVNCVVFSHDSKLLASASYDKTVKIWETNTSPLKQTPEGHSSRVTVVAFSHDSKLLASASDDNTVKIWDASTGSLQQTFEGHSKRVISVAFSHDSRLLLSVSDDTTVKVWDICTSSLLQTLEGHSSRVTSAAFSYDSKLLVSASDDKTVKVWDVYTSSLQQTLHGHSCRVTSVAFSHDSRLLVSASNDKTIKVWDVYTSSLQQTLTGHINGITSVAFSHDSKLLVSASWDKIIKIWDMSTGSCHQTVLVDSYVTSLSFDGIDSDLLVNGSSIKIDRAGLLTRSRNSQKGRDAGNCHTLGVRGSWVTWDAQNLLWIPPEYRGVSHVISPSRSMVANGSLSGKVIIIGFSRANLMEHFG